MLNRNLRTQHTFNPRYLPSFLDDLRRGYFDDALLAHIAEIRNYIVILSAKCLDRCANHCDWLRREITQAINTKRNIVPVLLPGFVFPAELDSSISSLPRYQGVEYSHTFITGMFQRIVEYLECPSNTEPLPEVPAPAALEQQARVLEAAAPATSAVGRSTEVVTMVRRCHSGGLREYLNAEKTPSLTAEDVRERAFELDFPLNSEGKPQPAEIVLRVDSPDFEPRSQMKKLKVPPSGDSEPCTFLLVPRVPVELVINLELLRGDEVVVSRPIRTCAEPRGGEAGEVRNIVTIPLIVVVRDPSEQRKRDLLTQACHLLSSNMRAEAVAVIKEIQSDFLSDKTGIGRLDAVHTDQQIQQMITDLRARLDERIRKDAVGADEPTFSPQPAAPASSPERISPPLLPKTRPISSIPASEPLRIQLPTPVLIWRKPGTWTIAGVATLALMLWPAVREGQRRGDLPEAGTQGTRGSLPQRPAEAGPPMAENKPSELNPAVLDPGIQDVLLRYSKALEHGDADALLKVWPNVTAHRLRPGVDYHAHLRELPKGTAIRVTVNVESITLENDGTTALVKAQVLRDETLRGSITQRDSSIQIFHLVKQPDRTWLITDVKLQWHP